MRRAFKLRFDVESAFLKEKIRTNPKEKPKTTQQKMQMLTHFGVSP